MRRATERVPNQLGLIGSRRMARRYSRSASKDVERAMRKRKRGKLKSGKSGRKVKSRKQAIAIGLSEARRKGKKVPRRGKLPDALAYPRPIFTASPRRFCPSASKAVVTMPLASSPAWAYIAAGES